MKRHHVASLFGVLVLAWCLRAGAATVSLQPSAAVVPQTSSFTVDLLLSAADAPGTHPGLFSGEIVIDFDPALITYEGFVLESGLSFFSTPTVGSAGTNQTVTLGFENAPDIGPIGTFTFTATGAAGSTAAIGLADADDFSSSFVNTVPTNQGFTPDFNGTSVEISPVPLPGAAWLMLTAFGMAGARLRRSSRATR